MIVIRALFAGIFWILLLGGMIVPFFAPEYFPPAYVQLDQ